MKKYTTTEIVSLIERFEAQKLPKVEWTHEAHLVVAIWYSKHYNTTDAMNLVRDYITKHNTSVGTPNSDTDGYHETITKFWLILARYFIDHQTLDNVMELCNTFIQSSVGGSYYPLNYYTEDVLFSVKARHNWVEPNVNISEWLVVKGETV